MLKLLKIVRDAGEVTTKYPFAPAEFTPTFRGKPEYDPKRCIACAACAIALSRDALMDGAMPREPASSPARSERMSPNMFSVTMTSNLSALRTRCTVMASMW